MLTLCEPHSESGGIAVDVDNVSYYYLFVKKKNKLFLKPRSLLGCFADKCKSFSPVHDGLSFNRLWDGADKLHPVSGAAFGVLA
jgi:hypothetical protein